MSGSRRSRIIGYSIVVVIIGVIVLAAYFQEQIGYFFSLRLWDKDAPSRVVTEFLTAVKQRDQKKADSYLGTTAYKPLMKDNKWAGYFIVSQAGTMDFYADEIVGTEIKPTETEFIYQGKGAAMVSVPNAAGKLEPYRLEMQNGSWKITEMRGGRPRPAPPSAAPSRSPFAAPGKTPAESKPSAQPGDKKSAAK